MKKPIEQLTEAQKARFPEFVERWTTIGLCEDPVDPAKAIPALEQVYRCGGESPPALGYLFFRGIESMVFAAEILCQIEKKGEGRLEEFLAQDQETIYSYLHDKTQAMGEKARKEAFRKHLDKLCYGHHEAAWLSFYSYMREVLALTKETEKATGLMAAAEQTGWFYPCEKVCLVAERPQIKRDEQGRLHNPAGAALTFSDGMSGQLYAWHGVRVPGEWILHPEQQDPRLALNHPNIEQRRALAEIIGWERVLNLLNAKLLHEDWTGQLLEADLPDSPKQRFIKVVCGTGRTFVLPVPSEFKTCLEAVAATYRVTPEEYSRLQGRT